MISFIKHMKTSILQIETITLLQKQTQLQTKLPSGNKGLEMRNGFNLIRLSYGIFVGRTTMELLYLIQIV